MNIQKIKNALKNSKADALMLTGETSRLWATGFHSTAGILLATAENAYFFTDSRYFESAQHSVQGTEVRLIGRGTDYYAAINEAMRENGASRLGFEENSVTFSLYERFTEKLEAELIPAANITEELRAVKNRTERSKTES